MYKLRIDARDRFADARVVVITFGCRGVALNAMVSSDMPVESNVAGCSMTLHAFSACLETAQKSSVSPCRSLLIRSRFAYFVYMG